MFRPSKIYPSRDTVPLNLFNLGNEDVELEARHHLDGNSGLRLNSQEGAVLLLIRGETLHQLPVVGVSLLKNHGNKIGRAFESMFRIRKFLRIQDLDP
jgi:hypothetical protein